MDSERRLIIACSVVFAFMLLFYATQKLNALEWIASVLSEEEPLTGAALAQGSEQLAVDVCQREVRNTIGPELRQMKVDSFSTRYDESNQSYIIFIDLILAGQEDKDTYARCDVHAVTQQMLRYRLNGTGNPWDFFQRK